jgi:hypothetical protein
MTTLGTDSFIRADNPSSWGTASDGNTYTNTGGGTEAISTNHGTISSPLADANMQHGTYTSGNMDVLVRVTPTNTGDIFGPQARYSVSGGNISCYKFLCYGGAIHINKSVSGSGSQLTSVTFAISANQAYWMRLRTIGTAMSGAIWLDGSAEGTATTTSTTDSSVASGGAALLGNTATTNVVKFDSLTVTDGSTSSTRTIPTSAVLLQTSVRTVPTSGVLKQTSARTVPTSAVLLATKTRTIPTSAVLSGVSNITANATFYARSGSATCYVRSGQATFYVRE